MGDYYSTIKEKGYYLIAEVGVNYYDIAKKLNISDMEAAKIMIKEAKSAGVDAVKFQTYTAGKIASKNSPSYWDTSEEATTSQYELFKKFDKFGQAEYQEIKEYCDKIDIEFFSTPFDFEAADYLENMMNLYKISSSDLSNIPFIKHIAKKNKPIILSVGASNYDEIVNAINEIKGVNDKQITLLHCVLEYPTPPEDANLNKIITLKSEFPDLIIGYSDHTKPLDNYEIIKTAFNLGATVIEKHFTLDKTLSGNDHYHAMDPKDVENIIDSLELMKKIRGQYELKCLDTEIAARKNARRSIVAIRRINKGEYLTEDMFTFKRPGDGICPSMFESVIGKKLIIDIEEDTTITWEMLEK